MKLTLFKELDFLNAVKALFNELRVPMNYVADEPTTAKEILKDTFKYNSTFDLINDVYFVGMVDDAAFVGNKSLSADKIKSDYDGILIFGITLNQRDNNLLPTRSQLAEISRAFNREFYYTPVVLVFKYRDNTNEYIAFANTERLKYKQEWREGEKVGKVSLLRDVNIEKPHRGHEDIINQLKIPTSGTKQVDSFKKLYDYWQEVFSVNILNKKFYQELSNWYFWAIKNVRFPSEPTKEDAIRKNTKLEDLIQEHNATNVIRLLTRLLFTWFIKEKGLIPEKLFDLDALQKEILKDISPYHDEDSLFKDGNKESVYYKAILQNLFFATLNCPIKADGEDKRTRGFRGDESYGKHRGIDWMMRYKKYFKNPDAFLEMVNKVVPFLNGGLFECLDDKTQNLYIDGFSDKMTKGEHLVVPDYLFFGTTENVDLSADYGVKNRGAKQAAVKGLINILKSYKFTITENTPIEEDVALDPELLGKVFENLLASYNPETKTTARKQTGSFYTPREIVNYMVDESLIAYLKSAINNSNFDEEGLDKKFHQLLSFNNINPFADYSKTAKQIVYALDHAKILDPAAGSGAFPMGVLQKMVHILQKLDPNNEIWKEVQLEKALAETKNAYDIEDKKEREQKLIEINNAFDKQVNDPDFARKLYLIENCIYGVDIQPIATQISKLRFFISLVVDQKVQRDKPNFGIRPLPNLETKFVTANTLIGIEKENSLFYTDEVKNLETELKKIRHKLFSARTKETKVKYRQKDKEIREELSKRIEKELNKEINAKIKNDKRTSEIKYFESLIKKNENYLKKIEKLKSELEDIKNSYKSKNNKLARQLASWDPYDQNASSPFFDPEWMFDIKDGFDIVIGNPPYKQMPKGIVSIKQYPYSEGRDKGKQNLYKVFIERSFNLAKNNSYNCLIVQSSILGDLSSSSTRELLLKHKLKFIVEFPKKAPTPQGQVFENVLQGTVIYLLKKEKSDNNSNFKLSIENDITTINNLDFEVLYQHELIKFYPNYNFIPLVKKGEFKIIQQLNHTKDYNFKHIYIHQSQGDLNLTSEKKYFGTNIKSNIKLYRGKNVHRFYIDDKVNEFVKKGYKKEIVINNRKFTYLVCQQVTGTTDKYRLHFAKTKKNESFLFGNSVNKILISKKMSYKLLGILNSKLLDWLFRKTSTNNHVNGYEIDLFPIKNIMNYPSILGKFIEWGYYSDKLYNFFDIVNNAIAFNLYFPNHMKDLNIDVLESVEQDINEVMQDKKFGQLSYEEKNQIIEELHQKWTDPDNEVVKRIALFKEKSPDILKVIIES